MDLLNFTVQEVEDKERVNYGRTVSSIGTEVSQSQQPGNNEEYLRFRKVLGLIKSICSLSDFDIEGRIALTDRKTGRHWR